MVSPENLFKAPIDVQDLEMVGWANILLAGIIEHYQPYNREARVDTYRLRIPYFMVKNVHALFENKGWTVKVEEGSQHDPYQITVFSH